VPQPLPEATVGTCLLSATVPPCTLRRRRDACPYLANNSPALLLALTLVSSIGAFSV